MKGDLIVPVDQLPVNLKESMGTEWRRREINRQILREQGFRQTLYRVPP